MRPHFALALVLTAAGCRAQEVPINELEVPINGLEAYVGKDLRQLEEEDFREFARTVKAITGKKPKYKEWSSLAPWWVKEFHAGSARWMFLEAYPGYDIPDISAGRVHIFGRNWKRIGKQAFSTGYRFFLNEAKIVTNKTLDQDLLVIQITSSGPFLVRGKQKKPAFEQGDYQRQYYALRGDRLVLVRLEDNEGRLVRNHYRWSAPPKGPPVPKRTKTDWIQSLDSPVPIEQLATLVWLSGLHLASAEPRDKNVNQESVKDSALFEAVRDSPRTKEIIRRLTGSEQPWVKKYAKFALQALQDDG